MTIMLDRVRRFLSLAGRGVIDLVDPPMEACVFCGRPTSAGLSACMACHARIARVIPPFCRLCGRPIRMRIHSSGLCPECLREPPFFIRARAAGVYDGFLRQAVLGLKYGGQMRIAEPLAEWMAREVRADDVLGRCDIVVPVPVHPGRLLERGYNHAELLSGRIAKILKKRHGPAVLRRIRQTERQSELNRRSRLENIRGAFESVNPGEVAGRKALLVDDVLTTGSTASECAKALLRAGSTAVAVVVLAVAPLERGWVSAAWNAGKGGGSVDHFQ